MVFMKNADRAPLESNPGFEVNPKRDRCTNVLGVGQFGREIYNMTTCILVLKEKQKNNEKPSQDGKELLLFIISCRL